MSVTTAPSSVNLNFICARRVLFPHYPDDLPIPGEGWWRTGTCTILANYYYRRYQNALETLWEIMPAYRGSGALNGFVLSGPLVTWLGEAECAL